MSQYLVAITTPTTTTRPSQRTKRWTAEALAWGRKAVIASRAPVEVRPLH